MIERTAAALLDAMEAWLKKGAPVPQLGRIKNLGPPPAS